MEQSITGLFENPIYCPDVDLQDRFAALIGLDEHKLKMGNILSVLVNPEGLISWKQKYHPEAGHLLKTVLRRPPLVILAGDVGSGKTELAQTIGDYVARKERISISVYPISLSTRGEGRVGEMTQLLTAAFGYTISEATKLKSSSGKTKGAVLLLVDEADAIAQSREASQMHHEDRAGVNAFIRGIDQISNANIPAAVIMCTNRPDSLDPAVKRRAAEILIFKRPSDEQRRSVLSKSLIEVGFSNPQIEKLVEVTGATSGRNFGYTFSDLTQRLIPSIVLDAYPNSAVDPKRAIEIAKTTIPTPPFQDNRND